MNRLEEIRDSAERQDMALLRLFAKRAKYYFNPQVYFDRQHPILQRDSCLSSYINRVYLPILKVLCEKSDYGDSDEVISLDREIAFKLMKRTSEIGQAVVEYKDPRGLPVHIKKIEKQKKRDRVAQSLEEGLYLDPRKVRIIFNLVFRETRRIEEYVKSAEHGRRSTDGGLRTIATDSKDLVESIKSQLENEGQRLPGKHSVGVSQTPTEIGTRYSVTLF